MPLSGPISGGGGGGGGAANVDSTVPVDGDILVGRTSTGKYMNGVLAVGSTKLTVTTGAGTISIDANEANFTLSSLGGILSLAKGGTNKNMTAANGGMVYSDADSLELLAPTATANQVILSGSSTAPSWSAATYPASTTVNNILYSSSTNIIDQIATANNGVLITSGAGIPSISSTIPSAVQGNITSVGTVASGTWNGSIITGTYGGTGINNGASTITLGGSLTTSGAFASTFTMTGITSVTFPTSGTLATTSQLISTPVSISNGGTQTSTAPTSGQLLIGKSDNTYAVATLTNSANITMTNGNGTITPNTIQDIQTTSSPTFASLALNGDVATGLTISGTKTAVASSLQMGIRIVNTFNPVSDANVVGFYNTTVISETDNAVSTPLVNASRNELSFAGTNVGATVSAYAQYNRIILNATMTGTITTVYGVAYIVNGGTDPGTVTTAYGLHIPRPDFGTGRYCAYLEGPVGINRTTPTETFEVNGSETHKRTATATSYVVVASDYLVAVVNTAAARTITLPAAAATTVGRTVIIQDESGGADINNITIDTAGGNINGGSSYIIGDNYGGATAVNNGTNWFIINNAIPRSTVQASQVQSWMGI